MSRVTAFDAGLRHSLEILMCAFLPNHAWQQAILSMHLGGLGFKQAKTTAPSSFIFSCNSTRQFNFCYSNYVQTFGATYFTSTATSDALLSGYIPGEDEGHSHFKIFLLIFIRRLLQTCHLCLRSLYSHR